MRRLYSRKRALTAELLKPVADKARLTGLESGLSVLIELNEQIGAEEVSTELAKDRILIPPLSRYCRGTHAQPNALVCGYAEPELKDLRTGINTVIRRLS